MTKKPKPPFPEQPITPPGIEAKMEPKPHYEAESYHPAGKLKNKVALISGGDSGIGRSVALLFAREGADVALVFLPEEQQDADKIKQDIESLGRKVLLIAGDLKQADFCKKVVKDTLDFFKKIDIIG
ncbi:SDR family NAD(P)-dependent oxidoreductase [Legionella sainthelensi]|uniref:SDR family NAD(P)-dependent oxidoreductase n=1 Tax=Legionella sainthelensi TaxID=28087 RepID=UPI0021661268|nr:SDR family NAD(P)-dependent oxidoreductase [Legionella sainthelensi]